MSLLLRYISFLCQNDFPHPHFEPTGPFLGPLVHASRVMTFDTFMKRQQHGKEQRAWTFFAHFFFLFVLSIFDCENRTIEYGMHQRGALK